MQRGESGVKLASIFEHLPIVSILGAACNATQRAHPVSSNENCWTDGRRKTCDRVVAAVDGPFHRRASSGTIIGPGAAGTSTAREVDGAAVAENRQVLWRSAGGSNLATEGRMGARAARATFASRLSSLPSHVLPARSLATWASLAVSPATAAAR